VAGISGVVVLAQLVARKMQARTGSRLRGKALLRVFVMT
jgi:hypothetical protein